MCCKKYKISRFVAAEQSLLWRLNFPPPPFSSIICASNNKSMPSLPPYVYLLDYYREKSCFKSMTHWHQFFQRACSLISTPSASVYFFSDRVWKMAGLHAFTCLCTVIICMAQVCSMPTNCRLQRRLVEKSHDLLEKMVSWEFIWSTSCRGGQWDFQHWAWCLLLLCIRGTDFLCTALRTVFLYCFPRRRSSLTRLNR